MGLRKWPSDGLEMARKLFWKLGFGIGGGEILELSLGFRGIETEEGWNLET